MTNKELMINDWVYVGKYNGAKQICALPDNNSWCICYHRSVKDGRQEYSWLHPIPLTEDILKINGFEKYNLYFTKKGFLTLEGAEFRVYIEKYAGISADGEYDCSAIALCCQYVHQLQHILRICGFDEIANNFIVIK